MKRKRAFVGIDASVRHGAAVALSEAGTLRTFFYYTPIKRAVEALPKKWPGVGDRVPAEVLGKSSANPDPLEREIAQFMFIDGWIGEVVRSWCPAFHEVYVGLEGYAYGKVNRAHVLGGVGATIRVWLGKAHNVRMRVHDPMALKMWATGAGNADKEAVQEASEALIGVDWREIKVLPRDVKEDLADATALAHAVWTEWRVRTGQAPLSSLPEHQIRVFNRCTKTRPVSILGRDWIRGEQHSASV